MSDQEATLQDMLETTDERLIDRCCTVLALGSLKSLLQLASNILPNISRRLQFSWRKYLIINSDLLEVWGSTRFYLWIGTFSVTR